jgi:hypothetical protein
VLCAFSCAASIKHRDFKFNKGLHNPSLIKINSGNEFMFPLKPSYFEYTNVYQIAEKTAGAGCV